MSPGPCQRPIGPPNNPLTRLGASMVAFLAPKVAPRAPQRDPKGSPRPTKVTPWRKSGRRQWPFRLPTPPQALPKAPIFHQNLNFPPQIDNFHPKSLIFNYLPSIVDLPTYYIHPPTWVGGSAPYISISGLFHGRPVAAPGSFNGCSGLGSVGTSNNPNKISRRR